MREVVFYTGKNNISRANAESARENTVWITATSWLVSRLKRYENSQGLSEAYWRTLCFDIEPEGGRASSEMKRSYQAWRDVIKIHSKDCDLQYRGMQWIMGVFLPILWKVSAVGSTLLTVMSMRKLNLRPRSLAGKIGIGLSIWLLSCAGGVVTGSYAYATHAKLRYGWLNGAFDRAWSSCGLFRQSHVRFSGGRDFAVTHGEFMGWVPRTARNGDQICFLRGCRLPFVIRKIRDDATAKDGGKTYYSLIGDCYLQDLMDYPLGGFENLMIEEIILK